MIFLAIYVRAGSIEPALPVYMAFNAITLKLIFTYFVLDNFTAHFYTKALWHLKFIQKPVTLVKQV